MNERLSKIFWFVFLFILGGAGVLFILPSAFLRVVFALLLISALVWTIKARTKTEVNTLALVTAYVLSVSQFGLHFYFRLPAWALMLFTFLWVGSLFWLGFKLRMGSAGASSKILTLIIALAAAEITLALVFWPTHFLITSTVFFLLFYLAWMTAHFYMTGLLNWQRITVHVVFVSVVLFITLLTAQWTI